MIIRGGGGGGGASECTLSDPGPKGADCCDFGTRLRNGAKRETSVLFFSKFAYCISYDNLHAQYMHKLCLL